MYLFGGFICHCLDYLILFLSSAQGLGLTFCFVESEHGSNTFQG